MAGWDFLWMGEGARGGVGVIVSGEGYSGLGFSLGSSRVGCVGILKPLR